MNQYLVDVDVSDTQSEEFLSLIDDQREHMNYLMSQGSMSSFGLSSDRTRAWITINAESEEEVRELIEAMPLSHFMMVTIHELSFFNVAGSGLPAISLN